MNKSQINYFPWEEAKTTNWSGGKTTELFIYPPEKKVIERDFDFRISTASVELEETDFSDFTGYKRILMIIDGKMEIIHEGLYSRELNPFEQEIYDGSYFTKSRGIVRDFNVIFKASIQVEAEYIPVKSNVSKKLSLKEGRHYFFIVSGSPQLAERNSKPGDLVEILVNKNDRIEIHSTSACQIIHVFILNS